MRLSAAFLISAAVPTLGATTAPADTPQIVYETYVGTGRGSASHGLAIDSNGFAYIAGSGPGPYGTNCGFLTKLNPSGQSAAWSICLPLTQLDGVALDPFGSVYVIGTNTAFPNSKITAPPSTMFKLAADDHSVLYSVQLGAHANQIVVDGVGNIFVAGLADSTFVPTFGAYSANSGNRTFAAKLNADSSVAYATYLDMLTTEAITISISGELWLAGTACPAVFQVTSCDPLRIGSAAAVRKLDARGASIAVSLTFGGGPRGVASGVYSDSAKGVAVDSAGAIWVVGNDASMTVATTPDALEAVSGNGRGVACAYTIKLSASGAILYGTYLSNSLIYEADTVALDAAGNVFVSGVNLIALSPDGRTPLLAINNYLAPIAIDTNGGLYGESFGCSATTPGAYQPFAPPGTDACVSKFDLTKTSSTRIAVPANAASLAKTTAVAPGELITISGANLPANPHVSFDGNPAPVIFSDANQITTVVPFHVDALVTGLQIDGVRGFNLRVWPAVPGLFTANRSGKGQLDARNQDGSANSKDNPAETGSIVTVYITGAGAMVPTIGDGELGPVTPPFPVPLFPILAQVNGAVAGVMFAAQAPGMVAGIVRVDIQIPSGTQSGDAKVMVSVFTDDRVQRDSQVGTIAIR